MIFYLENWLWKSDLGTFWRPMWTSVKVKSKNYFSFTDFFLLKSSPCWDSRPQNSTTEVTLLSCLPHDFYIMTLHTHFNCFDIKSKKKSQWNQTGVRQPSSQKLRDVSGNASVSIFYHNDELSSTMSWVG